MNIPNNNNILKSSITSDGILRLVLNNPDNHNVLSEEMMSNMQSSLDESIKTKQVRVIIISAVGPTFSAGHDLKELTKERQNSDKGKRYYKKIMTKCSNLMQSIVNNPKPVIAEINGTATAAGCQLVASCDLAYASDKSKFATPGVNIGLFCSTPMVSLSRVAKNKHSMEMLLTGDFIDADKAKSIGLINNYYSEDKLVNETREMAVKIANKSSQTIKIGKMAFYNQAEMKISEAYKYASEIMIKNMMNQVSEEGIAAFLEKREPKWP